MNQIVDLFNSNLGKAPTGYKLVTRIKDDRFFVSFFTRDKELLVSFGPTVGNLFWDKGEDLATYLAQGKDWLTNFNTKLVSGVHAGFQGEWDRLSPKVLSAIDTHRPASLSLSGFSQGGAHAILATKELAPIGFPITTVVFGTPRAHGWSAAGAFDQWLAAQAGVSLTRYSLRRDPITHVPLGLMGYAHVGKEVPLGPSGWWDMEKYHTPAAYISELRKL